MKSRNIIDDYFNWLLDIVEEDGSRTRLLKYLFNTPFRWTLELDQNRYSDGLEYRWEFIYSRGLPETAISFLDEHPCSLLEVMVAMADRMDRDIMFDPELGSRVHEWFWLMINNLELYDETNDNYDSLFIERRIDDLLDRNYKRSGKDGALFIIKDRRIDMRETDIWYQMLMFTNEYYE